ncbi:hypothetical protein C0J52_21796 [Blattella germanica]|nr:hypothetical protein C0J52_21796 [Blattella germanica]
MYNLRHTTYDVQRGVICYILHFLCARNKLTNAISVTTLLSLICQEQIDKRDQCYHPAFLNQMTAESRK